MNKVFLSSREAAEFLDISIHQLYKFSSQGIIPSYSPTGGKIYFSRSDLEDWVFSKRKTNLNSISKKVTNKFLKNEKY